MKKGISLIVLVITIIIIIILAGPVILSLNNNNPIENANTATVLSEQSDFKSALALYIADQAAENQGNVVIKTSGTAVTGKDANGDDVPADYYDISNVIIAYGDTELAKGADIITKVGMTPSKAAASGKEYLIAISASGDVKFYKTSTTSGT